MFSSSIPFILIVDISIALVGGIQNAEIGKGYGVPVVRRNVFATHICPSFYRGNH